MLVARSALHGVTGRAGLEGPPRSLQASLHSGAYLARLHGELQLFLAWATDAGQPLSGRPGTDAANELSVRYIQFLYESGASRTRATHTLLGIQRAWPRLRGRLSRAWDSVRAWQLLQPVVLRMPLPYVLWRTLVVFTLLQAVSGTPGEADLWLQLLLFLHLGFHALLRPGEALGLSRRCLALPTDRVVGEEGCLAVCLECPKTRRSAGRVQHVVVRAPEIVGWVDWLVAGLPDEAPLFTLSGSQLRRRFRRLCGLVGIEGLRFSLASLRAGGATHLYMEGLGIDRLRFIGRWTNVGTLERYVQEAAAMQCLQRLPAQARTIVSEVRHVWPLLSPRPWHAASSAQQQRRTARIPSRCF